MSALPDQLPRARGSSTGNSNPGAGAPLNSTLQVAGGLGLAGVIVGFSILVLSCAGFDASLYFSPTVIALGLAALILTVIGTHRSPRSGDGSTLASLFIAILCLGGGLLELAVWLHWPILFNQAI